MTLLQLRYLVEVDRVGSLSKAAKNLFVSQPNISTALKELEKELGLTLFKRTNRGVKITKEGSDILLYARQVIKNCDEIKRVKEKENSISFSLISPNYSPITESFLRFIKSLPTDQISNCELITTGSFDILNKVYKQEVDLGIDVIINDSFEDYLHQLKKRKITFTEIDRFQVYIKLRKGHPAFNNGFSASKLFDYPLVVFNENNELDAFGPNTLNYFPFINLDKVIKVNDRQLKSQLVYETDGYGLGMLIHSEHQKIYDFQRVAIPNMYGIVGYLSNDNAIDRKETQAFLAILRDELSTLKEQSLELEN